MRQVHITHFSHAEVDAPKETFGFMRIPPEHKLIRAEGENLEVSDGYHTFDQLYDHRITLWIALCKQRQVAWRSKLHSDGTNFEGWFILGMGTGKGCQMTYHLPLSRWNETDFAMTMDRAPEFDGHTSEDVLKRIALL